MDTKYKFETISIRKVCQIVCRKTANIATTMYDILLERRHRHHSQIPTHDTPLSLSQLPQFIQPLNTMVVSSSTLHLLYRASSRNSTIRLFKTRANPMPSELNGNLAKDTNNKPTSCDGEKAFADCEIGPITDLFHQYSKKSKLEDESGCYLRISELKELLHSIGERRNDETVKDFFKAADSNQDGRLHLDEFLKAADQVLGQTPARIVLVVGGPGSGKGILCSRMAKQCDVVHLSSGEMLREEVEKGTFIGNEVRDILARGDLVSSELITALIRRKMRDFPGRRVLLDGFPRNLENARDFSELIGKPELALHLYCDDTILMERILKRGRENNGESRSDDNIDTALRRLRNYHKAQQPTLNWLKDQHVPIVNLDVSGTPASVWSQLVAIGRLMRPATNISNNAY